MSIASASTSSITIAIPADLTSSTVPDVRAVLAAGCERIEMPGAATRRLVIDLRRARMIDSVGLNALVGTIKRVRAASGAVDLFVHAAGVERILTFMGLHRIARVVRDG